MQATRTDERTLTELDHVRLTKLMERLARADNPYTHTSASLEDVLDLAELVPSPQVSPDIVTMYSQVEVADLTGGESRRITVCYPDDAEPTSGFVSVLSPVGSALIGRRVGSTVSWRQPDGRETAVELRAVLFQPEATGDYTL